MEDVEMIVNKPERQKAIRLRHERRERKIHNKMLIFFFSYAVACVLSTTLGAVGWLAPWIAIFGSFSFSVLAIFYLGRWFEHGKCKGWKL